MIDEDVIFVPEEDCTIELYADSQVIYVPAEWRVIEVPSNGSR